MSEQRQGFYDFEPFRVDAVKRILLRDGLPVPLKPKVFETLLVLVENSERVLDKDELMQTIWPDTIVEENNLTQNISAIRKALGERRDEHRYVVTIPGRGYRFVADVQRARAGGVLTEAITTTPQGEAIEDRNAFEETTEAREEKRGDLQIAQTASLSARRRARARLYVIFLLAAALLVGFVLLLSRLRAKSEVALPETNAAIKSIAVLPFKSLDTEADTYIGPGMADALITKLSNSDQLNVRSTSAVLRYNNSTQDPLVAGRELGVDSVLDGKIQHVGDRVRVTVQLVRVRDGASLWAQTFDEKFTDIFAMQDSISQQVVYALTLQLSGDERERMQKRYTKNTEAYQAFLKGHYFMNKGTRESMDKSIEYFEQAIGLDPNYALAYAGLSDSYRRLESFGLPPAQFIPLSRKAATKALEIDETIGYAHSMLGLIAYRNDWDFPRAEREYNRARELSPTLVHQWYAFYLLIMSRESEADAEIKRFAEDQPFSLIGNSSYGLYYFYKRQYDQAADQLHKTLEMDSNFPHARNTLGLVYEQKGLYREAIAEFQKAIEFSDGNMGLSSLGHVYAIMGRGDEAREVLRKLAERAKRVYVSPYEAAVIQAGLGQKDKALSSLEKAYADHSLWPTLLRFDPRLDDIRAEPRFKDLLQHIGLK
jgi:DNA-binding winged helix-turn-helix (wHTH) protein/TolB-like protein